MASFGTVSGLAQESPFSAAAFAIATLLFLFVATPKNAIRWESDITRAFCVAAFLSIAAGIVGLTLNFPAVQARNAEAERTAAIQAAAKATADKLRYHKAIAADVFEPLPAKGQMWAHLKARWADVNRLRLQAAKLAVDEKSCGSVSSVEPTSADPLTFTVTCGNDSRLSFDEDTISAGGQGTPVSSDEDSSDTGESEEQINADSIRYCIQHPNSFGHSFMCSDVPDPPQAVIVVVPPDDDSGDPD